MPLLPLRTVLQMGSLGLSLVGDGGIVGAVGGRMAGVAMKFEIKNRWNGMIIFSLETKSLKLCVEAAIKAKADLRSANLSLANLRSADLSLANLRSANLSLANLRSADLSLANLRSADLSSADLSSAEGLNKNLTTSLRILLDQPGAVRAYKLVKENGQGPYNGGINYLDPKVDEFSVPMLDTDENKLCPPNTPGVYLATLDWCMKEWKPGYRILIMEFIAADLCVPTATDGKFRVRACRRVGEKDLNEIGLL